MARQMKNSGIDWIGYIPNHWKVVPVKIAFSEIKTKNSDGAVTNALKFKFGEIVPKTNFDSENDDYVADTILNYTVVEPKTVMINGLNLNYDFKTLRTGLVKEKGIITSAYLALKPNENIINAEYATYLFKGYETKMAFHNMGSGIRLTLGFKEFKNQPLLLPDIIEQQAIVDLLDEKCAEIDAVIEKTKATIEEYKKLKQSIITEAVTKGIRDNRLMKDSEIEWIGKIPAEWEVKKLKYTSDFKQNKYSESDGELKYIGLENIVAWNGQYIETDSAYDIEQSLICQTNDILFGKLRPYLAKVYISSEKQCCSGEFCVISIKEHSTRYMWYQLISHGFIFMVDRSTYGTKMPRANADYIKNMSVSIPPINEQEEIVAYLDKKCAEMDTLIARKTALLEEMESYKKSVIYEYVTGKKDCSKSKEEATVIYPYFPAILNTDKARFAQAVLMSRILDKNNKGMGRVKLEKMLFTIEHSIGFDFDTEYIRESAGPLDTSLYKCENIVSKINQWYTINASKYGVSYSPTKKKDEYKKYYEKYFSSYDSEIQHIIDVFKDFNADQAEIFATLFGAWNDFIVDKKQFTDDDIVNEVLNNWHDSKKRFDRSIWLRAIQAMRKNNIVPKGYGKRTVKKVLCDV